MCLGIFGLIVGAVGSRDLGGLVGNHALPQKAAILPAAGVPPQGALAVMPSISVDPSPAGGAADPSGAAVATKAAVEPVAAGSKRPPAAPPSFSAQDSPRPRLSPNEIAALVARGDGFLLPGYCLGALLSARRRAGDGRAAMRMAVTFDAAFLDRAGCRRRNDPQRAAFWYQRARDLGALKAERAVTLQTSRRLSPLNKAADQGALGMDTVLLPAAAGNTAARRAADGYRIDETAAAGRILATAEIPAEMQDRIAERARGLVAAVRRERLGKGGIDAFLHEYALSSPEGVALLCLAEALLRIPDAETVDRLIRDKIGEADWERHLGHSQSIFVNASTWALMLTGRLLRPDPGEHDLGATLRHFVVRSGEPVVRQAVTAAMHILGRQFVIGRTIEEGSTGRARPSRRATGIPTTCSERLRTRPPMPRATPLPTMPP